MTRRPPSLRPQVSPRMTRSWAGRAAAQMEEPHVLDRLARPDGLAAAACSIDPRRRYRVRLGAATAVRGGRTFQDGTRELPEDVGIDRHDMARVPLNLPLRCRCGHLRGLAIRVSPSCGFRVLCYCKDCRAFAHFLERGDALDPAGGTDIFQMPPARVTLTAGADALPPTGSARCEGHGRDAPQGRSGRQIAAVVSAPAVRAPFFRRLG